MIPDDVWSLAEQLIKAGRMDEGPAIQLAYRIRDSLLKDGWKLQKI